MSLLKSSLHCLGIHKLRGHHSYVGYSYALELNYSLFSGRQVKSDIQESQRLNKYLLPPCERQFKLKRINPLPGVIMSILIHVLDTIMITTDTI